MCAKKSEIPLYTKIGFRVTAVLMLLIGLFLIRNCTSSVYYGTATPPAAVQEAYELGLRHGKAQAAGDMPATPYDEKNPMLKKAYQKGFRTGWDAVRNSRPNTLSPTSTATPTSPRPPAATTPSDHEGK